MKMRKNYITPQIAVFTCNSESPLAGSITGMTSGGSDLSGGNAGLDNNGKTEEAGKAELSKFNSGMSWDDEE